VADGSSWARNGVDMSNYRGWGLKVGKLGSRRYGTIRSGIQLAGDLGSMTVKLGVNGCKSRLATRRVVVVGAGFLGEDGACTHWRRPD
jgi:hypothetical protein